MIEGHLIQGGRHPDRPLDIDLRLHDETCHRHQDDSREVVGVAITLTRTVHDHTPGPAHRGGSILRLGDGEATRGLIRVRCQEAHHHQDVVTTEGGTVRLRGRPWEGVAEGAQVTAVTTVTAIGVEVEVATGDLQDIDFTHLTVGPTSQ